MGNISPLHLRRAGFLMRPQPTGTAARATTILEAQGQLHAVNLLTDGIAECLTAPARPTFSWQLGQPDGADPVRAVQSGYEVTVEDSQGLKFWSSGPVPFPRPARRAV
jgi:alpha-L-rhamnosidase